MKDELLVVGFHGTELSNVENIMKEGLKPFHDGCVFTLPDINWCIKAARQMQDPPADFRQRGKGVAMAIIEVIVPYDWCVGEEYRNKTHEEKLEIIEEMRMGEGCIDRVIPPSMLRVVKVLEAK